MTNDYGNLELHKVLLSAMKDVDKICCEQGIKYYLHAGTLLGAINHKGFIPWDDDVDISMMREDYERFVEIINEEYGDRYFLKNYETDPSYPNNRAKLGIKGTGFIYNDGREEMLFIDIIPLYYLPKSDKKKRLQKKLIETIDAINNIKLLGAVPTSIVSKLVLKPLSCLPRKFWGKVMDKIMIKWQDKTSGEIGILCYVGFNYAGISGYDDDRWPVEWYEETAMYEFEDTEFMSVKDWDSILRKKYGDKFMEPYPEEKRVTKHDVKEVYISEEVRERIGL